MTQKYYAILTNQGAARLANAAALGTKLNLTQMGVGDANGVLPVPDPAQTKLINQWRIAPLNQLSVDPKNPGQIIAEQIIPEDEGGKWIREVGLYDDEGVLIAVANCPETYKPLLQEGSGRTQTIRMILIVSSTAAITLKIDPSVVLATRKYVDDAVIEVKGYADNLVKNHEKKANPHNQYPLIKNALKEMAEAGLVGEVLQNLGLINASGYAGRLTGKPQIITSTGTYTPTAGCKFAVVELVGGGGGGGGCWQADATGASAGGGGGSGGYSKLFVQNPVATAVTIGVGGAQGVVSLNTTPPDGSPGSDTSFGSLGIAKGGYGGLSTAWAVATGTSDTACTDGGGGAPAGTGDIALPGSAGYRGQQLSRNGSAGNGADSKMGSGGFRSRGVVGTLIPPTLGGGGLGNYRANNVTYAGTDGANGICIIWEYF